MNHRTTSSTWIRGVANTLSAQGLDTASLFADAGLDLAALDDPERRWPTEQVSLLWSLAAERSGNPADGAAGALRGRRLRNDVEPRPPDRS
jgi:hypothetical protein